jgi:autotransporter family porin
VSINVALRTDIYWDQLMVDGIAVLSSSANFTWDSTTVPDGQHILTVRGFKYGGTIPSGTAHVTVSVSNQFATLASGAALSTEQQCANLIPATVETATWNTPFNQTMPTAAQLSAYASNGYTLGYKDDYTQYKRVDGQYTGSTDMIMRWAACKYGIDENVVRAQAWVESGWDQGGAGDQRSLASECVQGPFTALWNASIAEPDGDIIDVPNGCFESWSAWQTKVYYDWMTWPQIMESTAFAADFRYADQRACMTGAYTSYFASSAQQPNSYAADVYNYQNHPSAQKTTRVLWGCIGMHYSGSWYDSAAQSYISAVQSAMATEPWPH